MKHYYLVIVNINKNTICGMDDLETCDLKTALKKSEKELDGIGYYENLSHDTYARWIYAREYEYAVKDIWELVAVPQAKGVWEIY